MESDSREQSPADPTRAGSSSDMKWAWWLRTAVYGLLIAAAAMIVAPSVLPRDQLPWFREHHARMMMPSYDIRGGLRLVYQVDAKSVVSRRLETLAPFLQQRIREDLLEPTATVVPGDHETLIVTMNRVSENRARLLSLADQLGLGEAAHGPGGVALRLDA